MGLAGCQRRLPAPPLHVFRGYGFGVERPEGQAAGGGGGGLRRRTVVPSVLGTRRWPVHKLLARFAYAWSGCRALRPQRRPVTCAGSPAESARQDTHTHELCILTRTPNVPPRGVLQAAALLQPSRSPTIRRSTVRNYSLACVCGGGCGGGVAVTVRPPPPCPLQAARSVGGCDLPFRPPFFRTPPPPCRRGPHHQRSAAGAAGAAAVLVRALCGQVGGAVGRLAAPAGRRRHKQPHHQYLLQALLRRAAPSRRVEPHERAAGARNRCATAPSKSLPLPLLPARSRATPNPPPERLLRACHSHHAHTRPHPRARPCWGDWVLIIAGIPLLSTSMAPPPPSPASSRLCLCARPPPPPHTHPPPPTIVNIANGRRHPGLCGGGGSAAQLQVGVRPARTPVCQSVGQSASLRGLPAGPRNPTTNPASCRPACACPLPPSTSPPAWAPCMHVYDSSLQRMHACMHVSCRAMPFDEHY